MSCEPRSPPSSYGHFPCSGKRAHRNKLKSGRLCLSDFSFLRARPNALWPAMVGTKGSALGGRGVDPSAIVGLLSQGKQPGERWDAPQRSPGLPQTRAPRHLRSHVERPCAVRALWRSCEGRGPRAPTPHPRSVLAAPRAPPRVRVPPTLAPDTGLPDQPASLVAPRRVGAPRPFPKPAVRDPSTRRGRGHGSRSGTPQSQLGGPRGRGRRRRSPQLCPHAGIPRAECPPGWPRIPVRRQGRRPACRRGISMASRRLERSTDGTGRSLGGGVPKAKYPIAPCPGPLTIPAAGRPAAARPEFRTVRGQRTGHPRVSEP